MSSLRLVLLAVGILFVLGLAWWERRRPRQASERAMPLPAARDFPTEAPLRSREPALGLPELRAHEPLPTHELPTLEVAQEPPAPELPPLPPAAEQEEPTVEARPMEPPVQEVRAEEQEYPAEQALPAAEAEEESYVPRLSAEPAPLATQAAVMPREPLPELPAAAAPRVEWPPDPERRVVALRLVAAQSDRFAGRSLRQALAAEGFVLGRFDIFHKPDAEHRAVLSAAGLHRPGTFDPDTMDSQHYGGLSLFAVLPGPKSPPQAFDELVFTARSLNERLHGVLQDEQGGPLTPARIATLRERLRAGAAP